MCASCGDAGQARAAGLADLRWRCCRRLMWRQPALRTQPPWIAPFKIRGTGKGRGAAPPLPQRLARLSQISAFVAGYAG